MSTRASYIAAYILLAHALVACDRQSGSLNDQVETADALTINIDSQGSFYVVIDDSGERLDEEASRRLVESSISEDPNTRVVVQSESETPTEALVRVLDWLSRIGAASPDAPVIGEL